MTSQEALELTRYVALLTEANLHLPTGLEAAAQQIESPRLRQALLHLAAELRGGADLGTLLTDERMPLPAGLRRLLRAAARQGNLPEILLELIQTDAWRRGYWRELRSALAYPLLLLAVALVVADFMLLVVIPQINQAFLDIFLEFEMDLDDSLIALLKAPAASSVLMLGLLVLMVGLLRMFLAPAAWGRMSRNLPVAGPILWWHPAQEWVSQLRLLLKCQVPLPEAMACLPEMLSHKSLQAETRQYAEALTQGQGLADTLESGLDFPPSLIPLIRWGESRGNLVSALEQCQQQLKMRLNDRRELLQSIVPPLVVFLVIAIALWLAARLFGAMLPIIELIQNLT